LPLHGPEGDGHRAPPFRTETRVADQAAEVGSAEFVDEPLRRRNPLFELFDASQLIC